MTKQEVIDKLEEVCEEIESLAHSINKLERLIEYLPVELSDIEDDKLESTNETETEETREPK